VRTALWCSHIYHHSLPGACSASSPRSNWAEHASPSSPTIKHVRHICKPLLHSDHGQTISILFRLTKLPKTAKGGYGWMKRVGGVCHGDSYEYWA
jgi:hypothetical protein